MRERGTRADLQIFRRVGNAKSVVRSSAQLLRSLKAPAHCVRESSAGTATGAGHWSDRYHKLCKQCHEWERAWPAWANEDFDFEEEDEDGRPAKWKSVFCTSAECSSLI